MQEIKNHYNEEDYLTLDIQKGIPLFNSLEKYNSELASITKKAVYSKDWNYDVTTGGAAFWFDADQVRNTPLPKDYPNIDPIQLDTRFNLVMHIANYMSLLVINILYSENKKVLIEDMCCGMGNLAYYLSKLGFSNFSMLDNFSQLPQWLFEEVMLAIIKENKKFKYITNNFNLQPTILNIIAYPHYIKQNSLKQEIIPESIELFLSYIPLIPNTRHLSINNNKFFTKFRCLAKDPYRMLWVYCREDKYPNFKGKLLQYV